ncbi:LysM peptidoglycan-binding domain-containing protein [Vibrio nereis]
MPRHLGFSIGALLSLSLAFPSFAEEEPLTVKKDAPTTYTVVKGDTLWDISAMYLDSPWLWPRLWQVNPEIDNPHLIYPGDRLSLIWRNGHPVLSLKPMMKLSPKVRVLEKEALSTVNEGLVLPYIESDRLLSESDIAVSPRVLGSSDGKTFLSNQGLLYITGEHKVKSWTIYRPLKKYTRDDHQMVVLKQIATAELAETKSEFSGLSVVTQTQEILVDDIALPEVDMDLSALSTTFYPAPSPQESVANILGSIEGSQFVGQNQVVVIDRGAVDQLRQGSMFELYKQGVSVDIEGAESDETYLPDTRIGHLMVIRPYAHFSLALVTESSEPVSQKTLLKSPLVNMAQ